MTPLLTTDILTPEKALLRDAPSSSLLVPTARGQINILEHHAPLMASLAPGILSVFGGPEEADHHFVSTFGLCRVLGPRVTILLRACEEAREIDLERAQRALDNAREVLSSRDDLSDGDIQKWRGKIERAHIRIQLAQKYGLNSKFP